MSSHAPSQQNESTRHTAAAHSGSTQPGSSLGVAQQSLGSGPQSGPQSSAAASAQRSSQVVSQQNGSAAQTSISQPGSSQPGVSCGRQQSPSGGPQRSPQSSSASSAQRPSQALSQQNGSTAQTVAWHGRSSQPGWSCGSQQSPSGPVQTGQSSAAASTQRPSHEVSQQNGSTGHRSASQPGSMQPGCSLGRVQQSLSSGPQSRQRVWAVSTQLASQATSQQKPSAAQTAAWHTASVQPGSGLGELQQSLGSCWHSAQSSRAWPTQRSSQAVSQQ